MAEKPANANGRSISQLFQVFAAKSAALMGTRWAFLGALLVILVWGLSGPFFHFSDTWQLIINTATTLVTFLMVFLIQHTQNRDTRAMHLKLDEVIRSIHHAHNEMINIEKLSDEDMEDLAKKYERFRQEFETAQGAACGLSSR